MKLSWEVSPGLSSHSENLRTDHSLTLAVGDVLRIYLYNGYRGDPSELHLLNLLTPCCDEVYVEPNEQKSDFYLCGACEKQTSMGRDSTGINVLRSNNLDCLEYWLDLHDVPPLESPIYAEDLRHAISLALLIPSRSDLRSFEVRVKELPSSLSLG